MNGMPLSVAASFVMQVLRDHGYEAYIVGGAVRDYLLGKSPHDYDVSTSASVAQIRACFPHEHIIENNGEKHGTVTVRIEGENIEITEFRHVPHETPSIKVDLRHRDLTINAIAYDGTSIIDPCGGLDALGRRILTMGPNPESVIAEDPLRILRVLRFQAVLGFDVDKPTVAAIKRNAMMLRGVAKERILAELRHILIDSNIGTRMEEYPEIFTTLFPDLLPTVGFDQHTPWHAHTLYVHIAHVTQNTVADFISRFAALLHDNGKVDTCMREDKPDGTYVCHFYGHPLVSAYMAKPVLSEYRVPQKEAAQILFLVEQHDRTISPNRKSVRKALARIVAVEPAEPLELLKKLLSIQTADHGDHTKLVPIPSKEILELAEEILKEKDAFTIAQLAINGTEVMSLGYQGKEVGDALRYALDLVMSEQVPNEKEALLTALRQRPAK